MLIFGMLCDSGLLRRGIGGRRFRLAGRRGDEELDVEQAEGDGSDQAADAGFHKRGGGELLRGSLCGQDVEAGTAVRAAVHGLIGDDERGAGRDEGAGLGEKFRRDHGVLLERF